jgi:hypothetical protein
MNGDADFHIPDCDEFRRGYEVYNQRERRGPVYFEAIARITQSLGEPHGMAEGISILIRGWNYLFANFNFERLVDCIENNLTTINEFRNRNISSLSDINVDRVENLFNDFLDALQRSADNRKSPVSVAKALNPLAPDFFPLWDNPIADTYGCQWFYSEIAKTTYFQFCKRMKLLAERVKECGPNPDDRSLLKRIDEYNYSKYTMHWI